MENFPKADDICKILAACRKSGVDSIEVGPLKATFARFARVSEPACEASPSPQPISGASPTPEAQVPGQTIQAQQKLEEDSHEEQGIQTREQQIAELMITDPLLAEELMERGELEPIGESTDGSSNDEGETLGL